MGRREKPVTAEPNTVESLGATLRRARQQKSVSLSDLAQRLGYSKSHLSVVETGRVWPSRELLQAYETALDLKSSSLIQLAESLAPLRRTRTPPPFVGPSVEALLSRLARGVGERPKREVREPGRKALPANGAATRDLHVAAEWARQLAEWAATHRPAPLRDEIVLVTFTSAEIVPGPGAGNDQFKGALQGALANGWNVSHLRWQDGGEEDRLAQVTSMLDYYGFAGSYQPLGLPFTKGLTVPQYGLIAVPGRGALLLLPTRTDRLGQYAVYAGLAFTDLEATSVLWENGAALRDRAQPLATAYRRPLDWQGRSAPDPDWLRYSDAKTRSIVQPGDRFLVRDGIGTPSLLADPRSDADLPGEKNDPAWEPLLRALQSDRILQQTAFRDQMRTYHFRELLTRRGLERFAEGEPSLGVDGVQTLRGDRRAAWLQALVGLLETYPSFEVGLFDEPPAWLPPSGGWLVKGGSADGFVHLETTSRQDGAAMELLIEVRDTIVVQAMRDYFLSLWEGLPAPNRSKTAVIDYLTRLARRAQSCD